ncbi:MAG: SH3 domain-containing protein [Candidatus Auribacterota bacterium]|nr:SH3 domain-containing protein [Candidatus Auribacterota bacterium]
MQIRILTLTLLISLSGIFTVHAEIPQDEVPSLFRQANALYAQGKYAEAIEGYQAIIGNDWESGSLYYNLANSYFKLNNLGRAILNYRKAWNLSPGDPEISKNLEYAREGLRDDIAALPLSVWARAKRAVILQFPLGIWIGISAALYFLTIIWLIAALLIRHLRKKSPLILKWLGGCLVISIVISVLAYSFYRTPGAIILQPTVSVRYGPTEADAAAFKLHEGTEVRVVRKKDGWLQITLPDGKSGWLPDDSLGII